MASPPLAALCALGHDWSVVGQFGYTGGMDASDALVILYFPSWAPGDVERDGAEWISVERPAQFVVTISAKVEAIAGQADHRDIPSFALPRLRVDDLHRLHLAARQYPITDETDGVTLHTTVEDYDGIQPAEYGQGNLAS